MGGVHRHLRFGQCRLGAGDAGLALFQLLAGHQVAKATVTLVLALGLGQGFLAVGHGGLGLAQGQLEAVLVDGEEHLALGHQLVVAHVHALDQPGHVRGDLHDVGTDVAVTGPGRKHVVHDHAPHNDDRETHDQQRQDDTADSQKRFFHVIKYRLSESTAPSNSA